MSMQLSAWQWQCPMHCNQFVPTDTWKDAYLQCPVCSGFGVGERTSRSRSSEEWYWWRVTAVQFVDCAVGVSGVDGSIDGDGDGGRLLESRRVLKVQCEATDCMPDALTRSQFQCRQFASLSHQSTLLRRKGNGWSVFGVGKWEFAVSAIVWKCPSCS